MKVKLVRISESDVRRAIRYIEDYLYGHRSLIDVARELRFLGFRRDEAIVLVEALMKEYSSYTERRLLKELIEAIKEELH